MSVRSPAPHARGLLDSLRSFGATFEEMLRVRGALFSIELDEALDRVKQQMALAVIGAAFLHLALLLLAALVVLVFWDTHRVAAAAAMTLAYVACGALALHLARSAASARPFAATLGELERDLAHLRASP